MAASKQYAYYLDGNKVAVIEKDVSFDNNVTNKDFGPGATKHRWESPITTVTDGIEIKYSYSPTYRVNDLDDTIAISAYTESNGLLSLTVASMSASEDQWILITGSDKWNGLHQVNTAISGATTLILKTKYNGDSVTEASTLSQDVSVLEDESFEFDLPNYLQKALVYYVKAKMAEDAGQLDVRQFALREFQKMIEKYETSRISGLRIMTPGAHAIR